MVEVIRPEGSPQMRVGQPSERSLILCIIYILVCIYMPYIYNISSLYYVIQQNNSKTTESIDAELNKSNDRN
jgi:hypothetical protein